MKLQDVTLSVPYFGVVHCALVGTQVIFKRCHAVGNAVDWQPLTWQTLHSADLAGNSYNELASKTLTAFARFECELERDLLISLFTLFDSQLLINSSMLAENQN